jgi:hypothetical protein
VLKSGSKEKADSADPLNFRENSEFCLITPTLLVRIITLLKKYILKLLSPAIGAQKLYPKTRFLSP